MEPIQSKFELNNFNKFIFVKLLPLFSLFHRIMRCCLWCQWRWTTQIVVCFSVIWWGRVFTPSMLLTPGEIYINHNSSYKVCNSSNKTGIVFNYAILNLKSIPSHDCYLETCKASTCCLRFNFCYSIQTLVLLKGWLTIEVITHCIGPVFMIWVSRDTSWQQRRMKL